jgi:hypothetical protein
MQQIQHLQRGWALDNVQIQERKNSSYPGTKTFDIRRPHVSMFPLVEMKHPSISINAMGVKATNYGAMKRIISNSDM